MEFQNISSSTLGCRPVFVYKMINWPKSPQKIGLFCLLETYLQHLWAKKLTLDTPEHVRSSIKSIWPLSAASDGRNWQKSDEKLQAPRFHISFWPFWALFAESFGIKTYIEQFSTCLGYIHKVSSLFGPYRLGQMASNYKKVMKKHRCLSFWPSVALFLESISI